MLLGLLLVLLPAGAASAAHRPIVGIGDQKPTMFDDARFKWLGMRQARYVVPWHVAGGMGRKRERDATDLWMRSARRAGVSPLVGFGHGYEGRWRDKLPTVAEFRRAVKRFRRNYPWVRTYLTWNEANHCSQPTCDNPERAAAYYDTLRSLCRGCTVVAPAVLDQANMVPWLRRFQRAVKSKPRIYALHNYLDVNRKRSSGTRRMLRAVPGAKIWIAETGGLVARGNYKGKADFPENAVHAGQVTTYALRLAQRNPRIERVYLYHWNIDRYGANWDSGLIDQNNLARPGFRSLARFLGRDPDKAPKPPRQEPPANPPPEPPPPAQPGESQPPPPQDPPPPPPPEPQCDLPLCLGGPSSLGGRVD